MLIFPLVNDTSRKIIHIDIDPSTISKRVKVDIPIVGDVKEVIADMLNLLETTDKRPDPESLPRGKTESTAGVKKTAFTTKTAIR